MANVSTPISKPGVKTPPQSKPVSSQIQAKPPASTSFPQLPPSVFVGGQDGINISNPADSGQAYFGEFVPKVYVQQSNETERNGGMAGQLWIIDSIGDEKPTVSIDNSSPSNTTTETKATNWPLLISLAGLFLAVLTLKLKN